MSAYSHFFVANPQSESAETTSADMLAPRDQPAGVAPSSNVTGDDGAIVVSLGRGETGITQEDLGDATQTSTDSTAIVRSLTSTSGTYTTASGNHRAASSATLDFPSLMASVGDSAWDALGWIWPGRHEPITAITKHVTIWTSDTSRGDAADRVISDDSVESTDTELGSRDESRGSGDTTGQVASEPTRIYVRNAEGNRYFVAFLLEDQVFQLEPGEDVTVEADRAKLRFDRGGGLGSVTRDVVAGRYEFQLTVGGWELLSVAR